MKPTWRYYGSTGTGPVPLTPTGYGLPGYEPGRYSTHRPLRDVEWCDEAGCPKDKCVHCKETA